MQSNLYTQDFKVIQIDQIFDKICLKQCISVLTIDQLQGSNCEKWTGGRGSATQQELRGWGLEVERSQWNEQGNFAPLLLIDFILILLCFTFAYIYILFVSVFLCYDISLQDIIMYNIMLYLVCIYLWNKISLCN